MEDDRWERRRKASEWLRTARERRGFSTATDFARALAWDQRLVSNYETGRSDVPDDRAEHIATVLGMPILEVRRGLGLWVPDDSAESKPVDEPQEDPVDRMERLLRELDELAADLRRDREEGRRAG